MPLITDESMFGTLSHDFNALFNNRNPEYPLNKEPCPVTLTSHELISSDRVFKTSSLKNVLQCLPSSSNTKIIPTLPQSRYGVR